MQNNNSIYLDYNATTPVAPEVVEAMALALTEHFGNPSSPYESGRKAAAKIAQARSSVAALIGANPDEVYFAGCATEANNMALLGVARSVPQPRHLIISAIEHPAIMEPARYLESQGWDLTIVPVDENGLVSAGKILDAVRDDTALVSIMLANNEVGTIQPIAEIADVLRCRGVLLHTDAAQAVGKVEVDVDSLGVDLLTLTGHKFYASKGIGALYVRRGTPIQSVLFGAGHEAGLRPGTENTPAIIGLGVAAELAIKQLHGSANNLQHRIEMLHKLLEHSIPGLELNGHPDLRLPNTLNVSFPGVSGQQLLATAGDEIMASVGSACHSKAKGPSGVLGAMGVSQSRVAGAVRLSIGWNTTNDEIERASKTLIRVWEHLNGS